MFRLMLFIPFLRMFMLSEEWDDTHLSASREDYIDRLRAEIVPLWARALVHMYELGWPDDMSLMHKIMTSKQRVKPHWYSQVQYRPVYRELRGTALGGGFIMMRNGQLWCSELFAYKGPAPRASRPTHKLITDLQSMNMHELERLTRGIERILKHQPFRVS